MGVTFATDVQVRILVLSSENRVGSILTRSASQSSDSRDTGQPVQRVSELSCLTHSANPWNLRFNSSCRFGYTGANVAVLTRPTSDFPQVVYRHVNQTSAQWRWLEGHRIQFSPRPASGLVEVVAGCQVEEYVQDLRGRYGGATWWDGE